MPLELKDKWFIYPYKLEKIIAYDNIIQQNISTLFSNDIYKQLIQDSSFDGINSMIKDEILNSTSTKEPAINIISNISSKFGEQIKSILLQNSEEKIFTKIWITKNSTSHVEKLFDKLLKKYYTQDDNNSLLATIIIYAIAISEIEQENR